MEIITYNTVLRSHSIVFRIESEEYSAASHGGTHMDAPSHIGRGGWTMDQIQPYRLIGPAVVINVEAEASRNPLYEVQVSDIVKHERRYGRIPDGAIVLINSGWSRKWPDGSLIFGTDDTSSNVVGGVSKLKFPGYSPQVATWLTRFRKIYGVGIDTPSLDHGASMTYQAHQIFFSNNIYGLENVANVDLIPERGATVMAFPMKTKGASGGPTRVIAVWNERLVHSTSASARINAPGALLILTIVTLLYG